MKSYCEKQNMFWISDMWLNKLIFSYLFIKAKIGAPRSQNLTSIVFISTLYRLYIISTALFFPLSYIYNLSLTYCYWQISLSPYNIDRIVLKCFTHYINYITFTMCNVMCNVMHITRINLPLLTPWKEKFNLNIEDSNKRTKTIKFARFGTF